MNLIYTQSSGFVYCRFADMLTPFMQEYANRIGAKFIHERQEKKSKYPLFDKFKVGTLLDDYDSVLFLDCDILVRPDSPDIFDNTPSGYFAAMNEGSFCTAGEIEARIDYVERTAKAFNMQSHKLNMRKGYFNCGMFVVDKMHKDLFEMPPEHPNMLEITSEQNLINLRLADKGHKTYSLPSCFNAMPWRWSHDYIEDNYFIHFAGKSPAERDIMIQAAVKYMNEREDWNK